MADCVPKIAAIKEWAGRHGKKLEISVDGGINADTGKICADAGATVLVAGSSLFRLGDMASEIAKWKAYGPSL